MFCLAAAVWAVACEDDNGTGVTGGTGGGKGGEGNAITLVGGTATEQTVYADDTVAASIRFTATAPWTVDVEEVRGSSVEWLTLSQYNGDAGDHTLTVTLRENLTGSSRKARITILSGKAAITLFIEQLADKQGGSEPSEPTEPTTGKRIKRIDYKEVRNSSEQKDAWNYTKDFIYDDQGRVIRIETEYPNTTIQWEKSSTTATVDYGTAGEIKVNLITRYLSQRVEQEGFIALLDEQGRVELVRCDDNDAGTLEECLRYRYTPEGYLAQEHSFSEDYENNFYYENGFWTKFEYRDLDNSDFDSVSTFELSKCYPNRYPNNGAMDFMGYFEDVTHTGVLREIGRLGRMGAYMPEVIPYDVDDNDDVDEPEHYETPNVTIHKTYTYAKYPDKPECPISYRFDSDQVLTGFQMTQPFTMMQVDYDIVVSDEWMGAGYEYTIQNRTEKELRKDHNTMTWEIIYE